ncbi:DUF6049 family protein [Kineococcus sp. SYSU DK006]|uniref:DUF6049 family protein n=1 Tax=Kineococcus sp. SYSU DK006 TaxID=3383127 RepID=UPI003D7F0D53
MSTAPTRRQLLAGLSGAAVLAGGTRTTTPSPTGSTRTGTGDGDELPLAVVLLDVTPAAYAADDPGRATITVRARVRNRGAERLEGLRARLVAQRSAAVARSALDRWARADGSASTRAGAASEEVVVGDGGALAAGRQAEVVLTLPAAALGPAAGAHPAAVEVSTAGGGRAGIARTFLVSAPPQTPRTLLTLLLPLVAGRDASAEGLAEAVGATGDGRLRRLLAAGADPRTAWAVDPALVAAARSAASGGTGEPARLVEGWLADLRTAAADRDVLALPHGDPDLVALERSPDGAALLAEATTAGQGVLDELGARVRTGLAWPADQSADTDVLAFAAGAGARTVVLDDDCLAPDGDLTYTPAGRATPTAGGTALTGLVADRTASSVLADAADADQVVLVRQRLLAEVATTTLQRPSDPRSLLLVAPRSFAPAPGAVERLVSDLEDSGWARWQPLSQLLEVPDPGVPRSAPTLPAALARAALPPGHVAAVASSLGAVDDFASALGGDEPALADQRRAALLLLGVSWRGHLDALPAARTRLSESLTALTGAVGIAGGSVRNLAAERSELPITVVNELGVPVQVDLVLRPRSPRVRLDAVPRQTVAARSQQRVAVPVRALANGSVVVEAQLRTPAGSPLGDPVEVDLNVRADVEGWISAVVGGGAGALLLLGLVRAVRRGRRRVDEAEHTDVGGRPAERPGGGAGEAGGSAEPSAAAGQG